MTDKDKLQRVFNATARVVSKFDHDLLWLLQSPLRTTFADISDRVPAWRHDVRLRSWSSVSIPASILSMTASAICQSSNELPSVEYVWLTGLLCGWSVSLE